jgi:hypothetical protein
MVKVARTVPLCDIEITTEIEPEKAKGIERGRGR